jgi:hypothetical protein
MTSARAIDTTINEESLAGVTISNPPKLCHHERVPKLSEIYDSASPKTLDFVCVGIVQMSCAPSSS